MSYTDKNGENKIEFNICGPTSNLCFDDRADYANMVTSSGACNHMSQDFPPGGMKSKTEPGTYSLIDRNFAGAGIQVDYGSGTLCNQ